jgi:hypothetical protein
VLKHWDERGNHTTERGKMNAVHQELYRAAILRAENKRGLRLENNTYLLSVALQDTKKQAMGNALNCFEKGTVAYCHNVTDEFALNLRENVEPSEVKGGDAAGSSNSAAVVRSQTPEEAHATTPRSHRQRPADPCEDSCEAAICQSQALRGSLYQCQRERVYPWRLNRTPNSRLTPSARAFKVYLR